jgi:Flp pilus assembly protein TadG
MNTIMKTRCSKLRNEDGVTLIIFALLAVAFVAFTAMAVDISHLFVVRNELHNAADAGALAGARMLYNSSGTAVNPGANAIALQAALDNSSQNMQVEVECDTDANTGDVQRGHWRFADGTFHPRDSLAAPDLTQSTEELDADLNFVNAVKVITRREQTKADSFFARILGFVGFDVEAEAVAYIGFAGTMEPFAMDLPIALCARSLMEGEEEGTHKCSGATMLNSGSNLCSFNTGGWTDYNQPVPCNGNADPQFLKEILPKNDVCTETGNPQVMTFDIDVNIQPGVDVAILDGLIACWKNKVNFADQAWRVILPVIDCYNPNVSTCSNLSGAVIADILYITNNNEKIEDFPSRVAGVDLPEASGIQRWNHFVDHFGITTPCGTPAYYSDEPQSNGFTTMNAYFAPVCVPYSPVGHSGGKNFGILAKIPVLVH